MSTETEPSFIVIVRGTTFTLDKTAVEFDSPNYFTAAFLEHDFLEKETKTVTLDEFNPDIFRVVYNYLYGGEIFSLPEVLAGFHSKEVDISSLNRYATYLQLDELSHQTCSKYLLDKN